jgi:hypothetical protein
MIFAVFESVGDNHHWSSLEFDRQQQHWHSRIGRLSNRNHRFTRGHFCSIDCDTRLTRIDNTDTQGQTLGIIHSSQYRINPHPHIASLMKKFRFKKIEF